MSHKRIPKRKAAIAVGGVAALGAAALLLPNANASQDNAGAAGNATPKTLKATDASDLASQLQKLLGDAFAGSYYDGNQKQLVVNVVSGDDNNVVVAAQKAGAKVRQVENSLAELKAGAQTFLINVSLMLLLTVQQRLVMRLMYGGAALVGFFLSNFAFSNTVLR